MLTSDVSAIRAAVKAALHDEPRVVLAVSGGIDSMVLLDAAVAVLPRERLTVATFDHGTGPAASAAATLVLDRCGELGLTCVAGRAKAPLRSEAELREARWGFLRRIAVERTGAVATAHTRDDQLETVLMRVLRGAGARGLAGLYAQSDVRRPLVGVARSSIERYAADEGLRWIEDPSNASRAYLRNRVRLDLLPALRRVSPEIDDELLDLARRAAAWRRDADGAVAQLVGVHGYEHLARATWLDIDAGELASFPPPALAWIWPAILGRAGIVLDRRAIQRLTAFTRDGRVGSRIQIGGGFTIVRSRTAFEVRPDLATPAGSEATVTPLALSNETTWGDWRFKPLAPPADPLDRPEGTNDRAWTACLPIDGPLAVRPWRPGDVMQSKAAGSGRKVKRILSDAGVTGHRRAGWPVVLSGDRIVWIPGVRRSDAATARSGRPGLPFLCEYLIKPRVR